MKKRSFRTMKKRNNTYRFLCVLTSMLHITNNYKTIKLALRGGILFILDLFISYKNPHLGI
jgi:hypothetical protein